MKFGLNVQAGSREMWKLGSVCRRGQGTKRRGLRRIEEGVKEILSLAEGIGSERETGRL